MDLRKISASPRAIATKGHVRRMRNAGRIPAVAYGLDKPSVTLSVSPKDLVEVIRSEFGRNTVIELQIEGGDRQTVLLADYQYHPITRDLLHADFYRIGMDRPVDVDVPFELTGKPKGVVMGGVLRQIYRKLPVRCLPDKIPVKIVRDVTELDLDEHYQVKDLELPDGVTVRLPADRTVVAVAMEKVQPEETETTAAAPAAGAAAPAEGAAAPAAGAAPAADSKT
jgi:large subunit ribosomal protein L25